MLGNLKRFHILLGGWLQLKSARLIEMFRDENLHLNSKVFHNLILCIYLLWQLLKKLV